MRLIQILSLASLVTLAAPNAQAARGRNAEPAPITMDDLKGLDPNEAIELIERAPNKVNVAASAEMDIGEDEPTTGSISAAALLTRKLEIERIDNWIAEFND